MCPLVSPSGQFGVSDADARFNPQTAAMLSQALANLNKQGIVPVITSGYRSPTSQALLRSSNSPFVYTPAAVSWHSVGAAVDFGPNNNARNSAANDSIAKIAVITFVNVPDERPLLSASINLSTAEHQTQGEINTLIKSRIRDLLSEALQLCSSH